MGYAYASGAGQAPYSAAGCMLIPPSTAATVVAAVAAVAAAVAAAAAAAALAAAAATTQSPGPCAPTPAVAGRWGRIGW